MDLRLRASTKEDAGWIEEVLKREWAGTMIERGDEFLDGLRLPAIIGETGDGRVGLAVYQVADDHVEIVTLNSFEPGIGIGGALLAAVEGAGRAAGLAEARLFTTNDNLNALGFYQRRGYRLWAVHRDTITRARLVKTGIPLRSTNGIAIADEIELRKRL